MKSDEALASPLRDWIRTKGRSMAGHPPDAGDARVPGRVNALFLSRGLHLGFGRKERGAVMVLPIRHAAGRSLEHELADPSAHGRLMIDATHGDGPDDGVELGVLEGLDESVGLDGAR